MSNTTKTFLHEILQKPISGSRPKGGVSVEGDIPSFGGENITMSGTINFYPVRKITTEFFNSMKRGHLKDLDVIINKDGANTGKSAIYRNSPYSKAAINEHLFILRGSSEKIDQIYLHYSLLFPKTKSAIEARINGSAQPGLNSNFIQNLPVKIFPLPEQKKIASILTSVDEVIENTQKQIDKLQDLKKATMNKLLTKGIDHTEFKDSELGRIPKSWKTTFLGNLGEFAKGKGISKDDISNTGLPCIRYAEIYTDYNYVIKQFKSFISKNKVSTTKRLKKNDIVFAGSGETVEDIGKSVAFLYECEAYVGGDAIVFSPIDGIDSTFLSHQLNDDIRRIQLRKLGQGSSIVHIYSSSLKHLRVCLPSLNEQRKIASVLTSLGELIEDKRNKLLQTQSLKKALMQDLLTGKVRVKVN